MRVLAWPAYSNRDLNPYTTLLYDALRDLGVDVVEYSLSRVLKDHFDIWHLHWPDLLLNVRSRLRAVRRAIGLLALMRLVEARGARTIWTVHNLGPHESRHPVVERWFWPLFTRSLDGFISLSRAGLGVIGKTFPHLEHTSGFVVPHGHYRGVYPDRIGRDIARRRLRLPASAQVAVFLGQIRPYKNVPALARAFRELSHRDAYLLIAGLVRGDALVREVRSSAAGDARIHLDLRFVPDDEIQVYLRAADLVVLPYTEVLNSGSAHLALSFDRPALLPRTPVTLELQRRIGDAWVRVYDGDISADILESALEWAVTERRASRAPLEAIGWRNVARKTLDAYKAVVSARG